MSSLRVSLTMIRAKLVLLVLVAILSLVALAGCGKLEQLAERERSPRQRYEDALVASGLDRTALGRDWVAAGARALGEASPVSLPFTEAAYFPREEAAAFGYRMRVKRGQRLVVDTELAAADTAAVFVELFEAPEEPGQPPELVRSAPAGQSSLAHESGRDQTYLLRIQPELLRSGRLTMRARLEPVLAFPVHGRDIRAVQSFWGAQRDGGRRQHRGVDIFAPRGTPVLAAAEGYVGRVGTTDIGGNVVWLFDEKRRNSLYYAHLDRQAVRGGEFVRIGDTLGFVGNTGNARTTPPHLHFGVYRRGEGAVDPLPFIDTRLARAPAVRADARVVGDTLRVRARETKLRAGPDDTTAGVLVFPRTVVRVAGAAGDWYRVRLPNGLAGWLPSSAVERAAPPIRRTRLAAGQPLLDRPAPFGATVDSVNAGTTVAVHGQFGGFVLVEAPTGRMGWVADR